MKTQMLIVFLVIVLSGCAPAQPNTANVQNTAIAIVQTGVALTQTALPTATLPPPTFTPTATLVYPTPSPLPTQPSLSILTPDAIQVERWKEYQTELAKVVLSSNPQLGDDPAIYIDALCEWDILGQTGRVVYEYVVCVIANGNGGMTKPAIIYLEPNGSIERVKLPEVKEGDREMFNYDPFPIEVQKKFCYYFDTLPSGLPLCPDVDTFRFFSRLDALYAHIKYRRTHPGEPPLVILSAIPIATPQP